MQLHRTMLYQKKWVWAKAPNGSSSSNLVSAVQIVMINAYNKIPLLGADTLDAAKTLSLSLQSNNFKRNKNSFTDSCVSRRLIQVRITFLSKHYPQPPQQMLRYWEKSIIKEFPKNVPRTPVNNPTIWRILPQPLGYLANLGKSPIFGFRREKIRGCALMEKQAHCLKQESIACIFLPILSTYLSHPDYFKTVAIL